MSQTAEMLENDPSPSGHSHTAPTAPDTRTADPDIRISLCNADDSISIAEGMYACFPEWWWIKKEPPALRPPEQSTRVRRLEARIRPSFSNPNMHWVKATFVPTGEIIGIAGWIGPGHPVHNVWRKSAVEYYGWKELCGWSDTDVEELWEGVDMDSYEGEIRRHDEIREELFGAEPHWYLAPLFTLPAFQGRGVAKMLMKWAFDRADATDPATPLYLESMPEARAMYERMGFVAHTEGRYIRRGPPRARGPEAEENTTAGETAKAGEVDGMSKDVKVGP